MAFLRARIIDGPLCGRWAPIPPDVDRWEFVIGGQVVRYLVAGDETAPVLRLAPTQVDLALQA